MKKSRPFSIENGRLFVAFPLRGVRMERDGASVLVERLSYLSEGYNTLEIIALR